MADRSAIPASSVLDIDGRSITEDRSKLIVENIDTILDSSWAKSTFMLADISLGSVEEITNRYWSSASAKFTDTRLGCNIGINPKPQFTPYSDIRVKGRRSDRNDVSPTSTLGNYGMGRYYSEAIDDPSQTIYLRFGVPQFNSVLGFLKNAYDSDQMELAKTGRGKGVIYNLAKGAGTITAVLAFPTMAAVVVAGKALSFLFSRSTSKYYTLKPTMHTYWSSVNSLVNNIAVNRGMFPKIMNDHLGTNEADKQKPGQPYTFDNEQMDAFSKLMPDVFRDGSTFDMWAMANRAQRVANNVFLEDYDSLNANTATDWEGYVKRDNSGNGSHRTYISDDKGEPTLTAFLNKFFMFSELKKDPDSTLEKDPRVSDKVDPNTGEPIPKDKSAFDNLSNYFDAEFRDGSQFAIFKVDHTGQVQESFGNTTVESDISQKLNGMSSTARQARFAFGDGNLIGGFIGDVGGAIMGGVKDLAEGALDGLTMGFSNVIKGLAGSGYIDIPKHWQSSSATLPRSNYTIKLISPYGNVMSQMQNIYIPLSMLLAGALPLSTGKQSYTSPFLCQLYDRGRCQVKLGIIESLSITRGTSNLMFNTKGQALAIDVTFTVADLSSIMHMPVSSGGLFSIDMGIDEDNILSDYLAVLAGQDLYSQLYAIPRAKMRLAKGLMNAKKLTSSAYWASNIHESATSGLLNDVFLGAPGAVLSVVEGLNRGSSGAAGPTN